MIKLIQHIKEIFCISLFILLFGCAEQPIFKGIPLLEEVEIFIAEQMQPVSGEQDNNVQINNLENKSPPEPGDMVTIHQRDSEEIYDVKVEKIFHAASGRLCIYFFEPDKPKGRDPAGLACLSDDYHWIKIPLKIIKNSPE